MSIWTNSYIGSLEPIHYRKQYWRDTHMENNVLDSGLLDLYKCHIIDGLVSIYIDTGIKTNGKKTHAFKLAYAQQNGISMKSVL